MSIMYRGYTFRQFVAAQEGDNFNQIDPENWDWSKWVEAVDLSLEHDGDCKSIASSCVLCAVQYYLEDYYRYVFHAKEFEEELIAAGNLKVQQNEIHHPDSSE